MLAIIIVTHAGMTTEEFETIVQEWVAHRRRPVTKRPYTAIVYQPIAQVLATARPTVQTFIVSGRRRRVHASMGGEVYGIPPSRSSAAASRRSSSGATAPVLMRLPAVNFIDDKTGKPIGIDEYIGRRPIAAFANRDRRPRNAPMDNRWEGCAPGAPRCTAPTLSANGPTTGTSAVGRAGQGA